MVLSVRSVASVLATVLMVSAVLAAFARPAAAVGGPPTIDVVVSGRFGDMIDTELVSLSLTGTFSVQGMLPAGPIRDSVRLVGPSVIGFHAVCTNPDTGETTGFSEVFGGDVLVDVSVEVGTRRNPETGTLANVAALSARMQSFAGTELHELGHLLRLRHGSSADVVTSSETTVTRTNHVSAMSYGYQSVGITFDGANLADYSSTNMGITRLDTSPSPGSPGEVMSDSFFDITYHAALPPGPNETAPSVAVRASSFFDVFARASVQAGPVLSPFDLQTGMDVGASVEAQPGPVQSPTVVFAGEHTNSMAQFHTLHEDLVLALEERAQYAGEVSPGPIQLPGDSFFDIFYELDLPADRGAGSESSLFEAHLEQPALASGLAEISGNDFLLSLGAENLFCVNC